MNSDAAAQRAGDTGVQIGQLLQKRAANMMRGSSSPLSDATNGRIVHTTPGGSLALKTPNGGRNPIRRRLRSPAMMTAPFKSSIMGGSPAPKVCIHEGREDDENQLVDGLSTLFVSPAPLRWGSKLGALSTPLSWATSMDTSIDGGPISPARSLPGLRTPVPSQFCSGQSPFRTSQSPCPIFGENIAFEDWIQRRGLVSIAPHLQKWGVERETDLRNLQEEEVDCSELSPSGKRRLVAAMRLMHHQASQVQESPPSSSPWRIDNGSTPLPSVAISEIPPLPTSAPPVSPAIFHYSDLEETNLEETDQFPPEPEPVPEYQSQTPNIRRGKCASLRLKGSSPSASNHSPSMDTSIADTSTDQSFPEISPSDISDMEKSDIGRGSESSIYVTPTPDTAKLSSTSPIAVAMAAAVTPMWSRQQEEGQLQETGPGIAVAQKDHEEHGSEEEEDVSDSDGNFVGPVVLTTNVGHTFPLLESADTSNKCNESEHQSVEQDGTAETTDYERAAAETMGTSNIRGLGPGKTAMPRMGTCENKKDDGNISDSDISDTESADGSDGINTPDSVKANKGRPSKPSACPGWAVAWSNTHSEWYWWDLKTRETSWNNPRHRVQSSSSVILRTASGKRVHVEDVRMISEDGGTSAVKQVVDKAGVHYALKVMRKTDVHWENVLNEKQVMVDLHMENHPFLVGLVATGKDAENLYMLLQLSKGGDLYQLLEEQEKFAPSDAMFFIAQIILALQTLHDGPPRILMEQNGSHEESYIHRDIKPENVLVGADGYCILADFGFTCRLKRGARTYTKCGTTEYMAPELILGQGYDCAADFWSLGIMLYELLVGYTPFSGNMENDSNSGDKGVHARILAYADGAALGWPAEDKGGEHVPAQSPIRQLILGLLARKPENRLGVSKAGHAGYESLFKHEWFTNVDFGWSQLKKKEIESRFVSEAWEPIITPGDSGTRDDSSGTSDSESDELGDNDGECADDWRYQDF